METTCGEHDNGLLVGVGQCAGADEHCVCIVVGRTLANAASISGRLVGFTRPGLQSKCLRRFRHISCARPRSPSRPRHGRAWPQSSPWGRADASVLSRFVPSSLVMKITPVKLAPGRLRLATRPSRTGSLPVANTTGTFVAAALAANAPAVLATITAACRLIRSANRADQPVITPFCPALLDHDIAALRREPTSVRPRGEVPPGYARTMPTVCCEASRPPASAAAGAPALSGHIAAAPPSSVMNPRRFIRSPRRRGRADWATLRGQAPSQALRLITNSYLVGACTGRSAAFSPLRMRST